MKKKKELDLLSYKNWFIVVANGLIYLDVEISGDATLYYDSEASREYPPGYTKPGEVAKECCPRCGQYVLKEELLKHIMSH